MIELPINTTKICWNYTHHGHHSKPAAHANVSLHEGKLYIKRIRLTRDTFEKEYIPAADYLTSLVDNTPRLCRIWIVDDNEKMTCIYYYGSGIVSLPN